MSTEELVQVITDALQKFAAAKSESESSRVERHPYMEVTRYYKGDEEVEVVADLKKKPATCDRRQCRCFLPVPEEEVDEWERFSVQQQQQQQSPLAAIFEFVVMIFLLLWVFCLIGNMSYGSYT